METFCAKSFLFPHDIIVPGRLGNTWPRVGTWPSLDCSLTLVSVLRLQIGLCLGYSSVQSQTSGSAWRDMVWISTIYIDLFTSKDGNSEEWWEQLLHQSHLNYTKQPLCLSCRLERHSSAGWGQKLTSDQEEWWYWWYSLKCQLFGQAINRKADASTAVVAMRHIMCLFSVTFYETVTGRGLLDGKIFEDEWQS